MDAWTIIALAIGIPASVFLLIAASVSSARMSRLQARTLILTGLAFTPIAIVCAWLHGLTCLSLMGLSRLEMYTH